MVLVELRDIKPGAFLCSFYKKKSPMWLILNHLVLIISGGDDSGGGCLCHQNVNSLVISYVLV